MTVIDTSAVLRTPDEDTAPQDVCHSAPWAAKELLLTRAQFELAVLRGFIRTVPGELAGQRMVTRGELDRLQEAEDFAATLREGVRVVGTADAAGLLGIVKERFTRIARAGLIAPARFQLNRYRSLVWMYFAAEVEELADAHPGLLVGRAPETMRRRLREGEDLRAAGWRDRMHQHLQSLATRPWERAAVTASFLDPLDIADVISDPHERALLNRLRHEPTSSARPGAVPSPGELLTEHLMCAGDPEEIHGYRVLLALSAAVARQDAPARGEVLVGP